MILVSRKFLVQIFAGVPRQRVPNDSEVLKTGDARTFSSKIPI